MLLDMGRQIERVVPHEPFDQIRIPLLQRIDDVLVLHHRPMGTVILLNGDLADRPDMDEQVLGYLDDQIAIR